ncbi:hypothetical protein ACFRMQ_29690 [Kitasatospora sp. NPDC056783]|uniref:hypothetical protein n=1 Tax=Kitasatospora sp. NPDC056783 TaxID=3345943 RepID=UPI0036BA5A5B
MEIRSLKDEAAEWKAKQAAKEDPAAPDAPEEGKVLSGNYLVPGSSVQGEEHLILREDGILGVVEG